MQLHRMDAIILIEPVTGTIRSPSREAMSRRRPKSDQDWRGIAGRDGVAAGAIRGHATDIAPFFRQNSRASRQNSDWL